MRRSFLEVPLLVAAVLVMTAVNQGQSRPPVRPLPKGAFAQNVEYIGFTDVNGHFPFKIDIQQVGPRW